MDLSMAELLKLATI